MTIFDTVKGTVNTAVDTISSVAQTLVEKNRTNAKLNRLRLVMKNECELMNRAYIALGKQYYEMQKKGDFTPTENQKKLFEVIERSKAKIAKARECYRKIVDSQNDIFYGIPEDSDYESGNIVDITVACSNENEYESSPFEDFEGAEDNTVAAKPEDNTTAPETAAAAPEQKAEEAAAENADENEPAEDTESPKDELF